MFSWLKPTSVLWHGAHVTPLQYQQMRLPQFSPWIHQNFQFLPHCDEPNPVLFRSDFKRLQWARPFPYLEHWLEGRIAK
jgi:hypothetical protein